MTLIEMNFKQHFFMALHFAKRDLIERYIGTSFGQFWLLLSPMVMIFIYSVIFSDFMKMRLGIVDSKYAYSIYLIPGLLAWTSFSNTVLRLNTSFFEKSNLIKKVNVPMWVFQLSIALSEFFTFSISMILGIAFLILISHPVTFDFLFLIPLMLLQLIFSFGLGVVFSLFTPFFKDMKEIIPIIIQLWFWITPIIYVEDLIKTKYPVLLTLNPFYYFSHLYQNIFLFGKAYPQNFWIVLILLSFIILFLAGYLYKKMIGTIKDII